MRPTIILFNSLRDGLNLSLLTVSASELETSHLESNEAIALLDDMHQAIQIV